MNREELQQYAYDPIRMQSYILKSIEDVNNGEDMIVDPSNPFCLLLEAATNTAVNAVLESKSIIRKKYPILATTPDELYHHISDDQMAEICSSPAITYITFYLSVLDMRLNAYRPTNANYSEIVIPIGSTVDILGYRLTLLNDILVRLYDNGNIFVEEQINDNEIAFQDGGILNSAITHNKNGDPYIIFEARMKQVNKITKNVALTASTGFAKVIELSSKYYYSEVKYKNKDTNGQYVYIPKSFSDEYIDPTKPTCYVSVYDNNVQFRLPDIYLVEGRISGTLNIDVYETKGSVYLPLNKYNNEDFQFTLGDTSKSPQAAVSSKILIWCNSRSILEGGKDGLTLNDLRDRIINNTTGDIDLPITDKHLAKSNEINGFQIIKTEDTVTHRLYGGYKSLPIIKSELLYAQQDILFNTIAFTIEEIKDYKGIVCLDNRTIIKSNNIIRYNNGTAYFISNEEREGLEIMSNTDLISTINSDKYLYNPFYYLITHDELISTVKCFDLDNPLITAYRITDKNIAFNHRVNIQQYGIFKTDKGYRLCFNTASNEDYNRLEPHEVGFQVRMMLSNNMDYAYFEAQYDKTNAMWYIDIETNLNIERDDNLIDLQNGDSDLYTKRFRLETYFEVFAYTTNRNMIDPTKYLLSELRIENENINYIVFSKDRLDVKFGTELTYLWNKIYSTYTERKYETVEEDIPMVYAEDEYIKDIDGNIFTVKDGKLTHRVLHKKGEIVNDSDGRPIYVARKGDVKLDSNGLPTIDQLGGVVRYLDMLLMEYEFKRATSDTYKQYNKLVVDNIKKYLTDDLKEINDILLENTEIKYRSFKTSNNIIIIINGNLYSTPSVVAPQITLYSQSTYRSTVREIELMKVSIGTVLLKHFDGTKLRLEDIRNDIKNALGSNIVSVKISGIESSNSEVLELQDITSRFILKKKIELDNNSNLIVKNDINITMVYLN